MKFSQVDFKRFTENPWTVVKSFESFDFANYELSAKPGSKKQVEGGLVALGIMDEVAEAFPQSSPPMLNCATFTISGAECRLSLQVVALEFGCITSEAVDGVGTQSNMSVCRSDAFHEPSEVERQVTNFTCSSCPTNEEFFSLGSFSAVDAVCCMGFSRRP